MWEHRVFLHHHKGLPFTHSHTKPPTNERAPCLNRSNSGFSVLNKATITCWALQHVDSWRRVCEASSNILLNQLSHSHSSSSGCGWQRKLSFRYSYQALVQYNFNRCVQQLFVSVQLSQCGGFSLTWMLYNHLSIQRWTVVQVYSFCMSFAVKKIK